MAKRTAAKGWLRCGVVQCLYGPRYDWRSWLGKKHFTFSGVRPHVCHHCARQHRIAHVDEQWKALRDERRLQRRLAAEEDEASLIEAAWTFRFNNGVSDHIQ